MSKASQYKNRNIRTVTLSDGTVLQVRKAGLDEFVEIGSIPQLLFSGIKATDPKNPEQMIATLKENKERLRKIQTIAACNCVLGAVGDDGKLEPFIVVDKPATECEGDEISFGDSLTSDDRIAIMNKVVAGKEVADKAATFREQPGLPADAGQGSTEVQPAPVGTDAPQPVGVVN